MTNICLNGLNNIAPTELKKSHIQNFYYDFAPTELIFTNDKQSIIWFLDEENIINENLFE